MVRPALSLTAIVAAYLVLRGLVLWTAFDTVAMPNYELMPMGNLAKFVSEGRGAGLADYYDNCGGHLVTGLLAAPLYRWVGDSYLVLKVVPLALGVCTLVLAWVLLRRPFGPRAAAVGALLFALGPPTLVKYSLLAKGNHFESLASQLLCLWAFQRLHESPKPGRWLHVLGLACGLAVSFYLGSLLWVVLFGAVHLMVVGVRAGVRDAVRATPGFTIGLAPLLLVAWATKGRPLLMMGSFFGGEHSAGEILGRIGAVVRALPEAGVYPSLAGIPGALAGWTALLVFLAAWGWAAARVARGGLEAWCSLRAGASDAAARRARYEGLRLAPLVLYLPAFVLTFAVGTFDFKAYLPPVEVGQYRYLVPHFTIAALLVGAAVGSWRRGRSVLVAAAFAPAVFLVPLVDWSFTRTGDGLVYRGYDLSAYGNVLLRDSRAQTIEIGARWDLAAVAAQMAEFRLAERPEIVSGVGHIMLQVALTSGPDDTPQEVLGRIDLDVLVADFDPVLHADLVRGAGAYLRLASSDDWPILAARLDELADHPLSAPLVEGLAAGIRFTLSRDVAYELQRTAELEEVVPLLLRESWLRGRGQFCGELVARGLSEDKARAGQVAGKLAPGDRPAHWSGFGKGWAKVAVEALPPGLEWLPQETREPLLRGLLDELRRREGAAAVAQRARDLGVDP